MTISLITGVPGSGKTMFACKEISRALEDGKPVATNVQLREDFPEYILRRSWLYYVKFWRRKSFQKRAREQFHFAESLDELMAIRLKGSREGRGLMVLDEAHEWMNARSWSAEDRKVIVRLFSQHRKLGWDVLVLAQHPEMIDKQVRNLVEYVAYFRNLKKAKWPLIGLPISPVNLFLGIFTWHAVKRVVVKRVFFPVSWRANLYDTHQVMHGLQTEDDDLDVIVLPSPASDRAKPTAAARTGGSSAARPPGDLDSATDAEELAGEAGELEDWQPEPETLAP